MTQIPPEPNPNLPTDLEGAAREVGASIAKALSDIVEGSSEDLRAFGTSVAFNAVRVAQIPDEEDREAALKEINAQIRLLAEISRIRVNRESWSLVERVVDVATNVLVSFISSVPTRL